MKLSALVLIASIISSSAATTYTEFYCNFSTGSNTNSGSSTGSATYSSVNGNWDGTSVFIPVDGSNPVAGGVTTNTFASVYLDGAAVSVYVARITAVTNDVNGGIVLDTSAKAGTAPAAGATGRSITVGGVWKGPNGASGFPFGFATSTLTNATGNVPRINLKNAAQYDVTAAMTHSLSGPIVFQGYSSSVDDGGKAAIDGGTSETAYVLLTVSGSDIVFCDMIFSHNGAAGNQVGVNQTGAEVHWMRCVFHDFRRSGINTSDMAFFTECESYGNNTQNSSGHGGFIGINTTYLRCISHDNAGSNSSGFSIGSSSQAINCIADSNGGKGFSASGTVYVSILGCDAYNNTGDGIDITAASANQTLIQNCNLVKNGGYGINSSGSTIRIGFIINCGFGSGTMVNTSGDIAAAAGNLNSFGSVTYAANVTPWQDPDNGNFSISLAAAKAAGRGAFTETATSYTGTAGHPDIGAAQSQASGSSYAFPFAQ